MKIYESYVRKLESLVVDAFQTPTSAKVQQRIATALDGEPASELRRLVPLAKLRSEGIFFTGCVLAQRAVRDLLPTLDKDSRILDPACGAGDLLIAMTAGLPVRDSVAETLRLWGRSLIGRDLHPELVEAAKHRLCLAILARCHGVGTSCASLRTVFTAIEARCGLSDGKTIASATHIVMNPPFAAIDAPPGCTWSSGKINQAALFLTTCLEQAAPGTRIVAILPDVLRSGSRYHRLRQLVGQRTRIERLERAGRFDRWADVDVFILRLEVLRRSQTGKTVFWLPSARESTARLGDHFVARVGPVVDYRDPRRGPWRPFIYARALPAWDTVDQINEHRRFKGTLISTPFVAVRRTSRPGDRYRAVGTLINDERGVAVENHLICLMPKDGCLESCQKLLVVLRDPRTTEWLDQRIRCRHLTVSSLAELPWWSPTL